MSKAIVAFLYNFAILPLLWLLMKAVSLFNSKVERGFEGRNLTWQALEGLERGDEPLVWIHCASHGEYEQGRPLMRELKEKYPSVKIAVTFFSPSGFQPALRDFDIKLYLPIDTASGMKRFIKLLKPTVYVLVSYDIWPNSVWQASKAGVPIVIMSARLHARSRRLNPLFISFQKPIYRCFDRVLAVTSDDARRLKRLGVRKAALNVIGNTRYDQVWTRSREPFPKQDEFMKFSDGRKVVLLGSVWRPDNSVILDIVLAAMKRDVNISLIIAPHETKEPIIRDISKSLKDYDISYVRYSNLNEKNSGRRCIIIDSVGFLVGLYRMGHLAYVGGGFGSGVHSLIEPAVYSIPVIYGPNSSNSDSAELLEESGGGFSVKNRTEFEEIFTKLLSDEDYRARSGERAGRVVKDNLGATERITDIIEGYLV